jgi:hypothetical protein
MGKIPFCEVSIPSVPQESPHILWNPLLIAVFIAARLFPQSSAI